MCSVVGFVYKKPQERVLKKMNASLSYRGPDSKGFLITPLKNGSYLHLAHNRLSILDISERANQPFVSECKRYAIVYNGEVYNFREIRRELLKKGYEFTSDSDTEVILYSYKEWGRKALDKFIGMFAFCIYDKKEEKLFLARDRAGVKPLYYYKEGDIFIFASEVKAFLQNPYFKKVLNQKVLPFYMRFGYIGGDESVFENLYKFPAASYMEYDLKSGEFKISRYWDIVKIAKEEKFEKSEKEVLRELEEILNDAFSLRTVADVPVGIFLSGGYDSSLVAAILQANSDKKLDTFSIGFKEKEFDESEEAYGVASYLKTDHHVSFIGKKELMETALKLPYIYDEPFADDSTIPTAVLSSFARRSVKVALSGDGGDEEFAGYSKYSALYSFRDIFSNEFKKLILKRVVDSVSADGVKRINDLLPKKIRNRNIVDKYLKFKRAVESDGFSSMFINASSNLSKEEVEEILIKSEDTFLPRSYFKYFKEIKELDFMDQMMLIDYITYLRDNSLVKVDRASMSVSLEAREPLLDHRIAEYMFKVPVSLKYKNSTKKYLLKKILYKYVPKELLERPKSGFQPPLNYWLRGDLEFLLDIYLDEKRMKEHNIFNVEEVGRLKRLLKEGKSVNINKLWSVLVFQMWFCTWM